MPKKLLFFVVLLLFPLLSLAQTSADYQFRLLFHKQLIEDNNRFGWAGWWVFPNMTAKNNTFRSLVIGGPMFQWNKGWIEPMAGAAVHQNNGYFDPLINVRASFNPFTKLIFFADLEPYLRNRRFYWFLSATTPVKIRGLNTYLGIETENITNRKQKSSFGVGPRIGFQLPFFRKATLFTAYEFRNDGNWLRHYLVFNFK